MPRACALKQEKPLKWEACTPQLENSHSLPQLEKACVQNKNPAQPKINKLFKSQPFNSKHWTLIFFFFYEKVDTYSQKPLRTPSDGPHHLIVKCSSTVCLGALGMPASPPGGMPKHVWGGDVAKALLNPQLSAGLVWLWDSFRGRGSPPSEEGPWPAQWGLTEPGLEAQPQESHLDPRSRLFGEWRQFRGPHSQWVKKMKLTSQAYPQTWFF